MKDQLVVVPLGTLRAILSEEFKKYEAEKKLQEQKFQQSKTLYSINQVAKMLNRSHRTIKKLVEQGILKTTPDGLISEKTINEYLKTE